MPFKKGQSGNPEGRPQGTPNKITRDLRKSIKNFLDEKFEEVVKTWQKLSDKDKVNFYRDLLQYAIPKLSNTELTTNFEQLTDEQLDRIIDELKENMYEQTFTEN